MRLNGGLIAVKQMICWVFLQPEPDYSDVMKARQSEHDSKSTRLF